MKQQDRRSFVKQASTLSLMTALPISLMTKNTKSRKFKMCLNPGSIGMKVNQLEALEMASQLGFEAITVKLDEMMRMDKSEQEAFTQQMKEKGITWGSTNVPLEFRRDAALFEKGLADLPRKAKTLSAIGSTRMNTWVMPTHPDLTYLENFKQHQVRLKSVANILGHYGIRLGLEYVGPKTLMARDRYAFIRTMKEMKELIADIEESNVGFVLDSFHWFCAEESVADLLTLENKDIVTCDLNDARSGFSAAEQMDTKRELPLRSKVIDLKAFLEALVQIGYDGPVRAEPFNATLNEMDDKAAAEATYESMQKAFDLVK